MEQTLHNPQVRRALLVISALAGLFFLFQAVLFLTNPVVEITSDMPGQTIVYDVKKNKQVKQSDSNQLKLRLAPGRYQVRRLGEQGGSQALLELKRRENRTLKLVGDAPISPEYLIDQTAESIFASSGQLRWVDDQNHQLYVLNRGSLRRRNLSAHLPEVIVGASWRANGQALLPIVGGEHFYLRSADKRLERAMEELSDDDQPRVLTMGEDGTIFGLSGERLVRYQISGEDRGVVNDRLDEGHDSLVIGSQNVLVFAGSDLGERGSSSIGSKLIARSGQTVTDLPSGIRRADFSDNDNFLAIAASDGLSTYELGTKAWSKVASGTIFGLAWDVQERLYYSDDAGIWRYEPAQGQSQLLAATSSRPGAFFHDGGSHLYFSLRTTGNTKFNGIYRLNLDGDPSATVRQRLSRAVPHTTANYTIDLAGFSNRPTVIVTTMAILNRASQLNQFRRDTLEYRREALRYLTDSGVDLKQVEIIFEQ